MQQIFSMVRLFVPAVAFLLFMACIPGTRRDMVVGPEPQETAFVPVPVHELDERIANLSKLIEAEGLSARERDLALTLLSAYEQLREAVQRPLNKDETEEVIELLYKNLRHIDEKVILERQEVGQIPPSSLQRFSQEREKVLQHYLSADYGAVIQGCLDLEKRFGLDALTPEIGLVFSLSLAEKGMYRDALRVGEKIKRELEGKPDLVRLQAQMVEWHVALGERREALRIYEELLDHIDEQAGLLKQAERKLTDEKPKIAHRGKGYEGPDAFQGEPGALQTTLAKVEALIQEHQFDQARLLLLRQRLRIQEGPETEIIDSALKSVDEAEERFDQEEAAKLALRKETLDRAGQLIEEEKYEEAIAQIDNLERDWTIGTEAEALRELAVDKYVNQERNRAAKLFLLAKRAKEPAEKEKLLLSSREILKALVEKYPTSSLNEKINSYITVIEEELTKLKEEPGRS
jgi:hypothetical protein